MDKKVIFVAINLLNNEIEVFSTKQLTADYLSVSYKTLHRALSSGNGSAIVKDNLIKECSINKCKKGFALS